MHSRKLWTSRQIAALIGIPHQTFLHWVRCSNWADPARTGTQKYYWTRGTVVSELRRIFGPAAEEFIAGDGDGGGGGGGGNGAGGNGSKWADEGAAELFGGNGSGEEAGESADTRRRSSGSG
jgi:hypothetical protein